MAKKRKTLTAERIFDLATIDPVAREGWVVAADSVESRHCVHAPHSELGEQLGLSDSRMVILSHLKYVTAKNKTGGKNYRARAENKKGAANPSSQEPK